MSLKHGFAQIQRIPGGIRTVAEHTFRLTKYLSARLKNLCYNIQGQPPLVKVYSKCDNIEQQGGICNFNILNPDGSYVGFSGIYVNDF